jgi:hypothetical protein
VFAAACVVETFLVSMQAWRGVPSHFNMETRFDAAVAVTLAIGGFTLVVVVVALAVSAIRHPPRLPAAFRSAIQAGLLAREGVTGTSKTTRRLRRVTVVDEREQLSLDSPRRPGV